MALDREVVARARTVLLPPALDLRDGVRTYLRRLGDDGGRTARMSRSSHRALVQPPAERLERAWREVRVELLGSLLERAFDEGIFVARADALNQFSDNPKHADEFDRCMRELLVVVDSLIETVETLSRGDANALLAAELKYATIEKIRWGGFGVVYRGVDLANVDHAIKVLHVLGESDSAEPRFQREAEALKRLTHPHIVKYQRLGKLDDGRWFLEMDFVPGQTLSAWVAAGVPFENRVRAILQLLGALEHAHEAGVFHRDIKPDNVMVREDDSIVLVDFGLAWLAGQVDPNLTTSSTWSLDYAPPEVREDPRNSRGPNHDIYSVGVVLYQALAGRRPAYPNHHPLADVDPRLAPLDDVVDRALAPLAGRFATAAEFHQALEFAAEGIEQPWLARAAQAARIRTHLLRDALVAGADAGHCGSLSLALVHIAGTYEALRVHWQREFRLSRGSDAPRLERKLPATVIPAAHSLFPEQTWLWREPALADDNHGPAALNAMGFTVSEAGVLHVLVETTEALRTRIRNSRGEVTEEMLVAAHASLVGRVLELESTEAPVMARLGDVPAMWEDDEGSAVDREDEGTGTGSSEPETSSAPR